MSETQEIWYRFEDRMVADYDPWAEYEQPTTSHVEVQLLEIEVLSHTPKGVWLNAYPSAVGSYATKRFQLLSANKQYACPTKELAYESYMARKNKQIRIYKARIKHAKDALLLAKKMMPGYQVPEDELDLA